MITVTRHWQTQNEGKSWQTLLTCIVTWQPSRQVTWSLFWLILQLLLLSTTVSSLVRRTRSRFPNLPRTIGGRIFHPIFPRKSTPTTKLLSHCVLKSQGENSKSPARSSSSTTMFVSYSSSRQSTQVKARELCQHGGGGS